MQHKNTIIRVILSGLFLAGLTVSAKAEVPLEIWNAIDSHDMVKVQKWLDGSPDINGKTSQDSATPLMLASGNHDVKMVRAMLAKGADVKLLTRQKQTALHFVSQNGDPNYFDDCRIIISMLIEAGTPLDARDQWGYTALLKVCESMGHSRDKAVPVMEVLLKAGANPDLANNNGETPLFLSARRGSLGMLRILIENKANVNLPGPGNNTALNLAAGNKSMEIVKFLLTSGADPNIADIHGTVPIHNIVFESKGTEIVKLLIQKGADVNKKNGKGKTPLQLANWSAKYNAPTIKLLKENGAK